MMNQHKIKLATREDSSTPFHFGRNDMPGGGFVLSTQVVFETWRAADCRPYGHTGGRYHSTAEVIFGTSPERHTGRSLRFRWWVYFSTKCISKTGTFVTNNCQLSIVNCQFFLVTPAAGPRLFSFWPRLWPVAVPGFRRPREHTFPAAGRSSGPAPGRRGFSGLPRRGWW